VVVADGAVEPSARPGIATVDKLADSPSTGRRTETWRWKVNVKHLTSKTVGLLALLASAAPLCVLLVGCLMSYWVSGTTVADVEKQLQQEVPVGTTRSDAEKWLVGRSIVHSYGDWKDFDNDSVLVENGVRPDKYSGYIGAIIRNTGPPRFLVTGNIRFFLLFDKEDRVAKHIVKWVGTGL
jgi:hypothetical protein